MVKKNSQLFRLNSNPKNIIHNQFISHPCKCKMIPTQIHMHKPMNRSNPKMIKKVNFKKVNIIQALIINKFGKKNNLLMVLAHSIKPPTCGLVDGLGCCKACSRVCHTGHQLVSRGNMPCFGDCGEGSVQSCVRCKCRRMTASQAQEYDQFSS